MTYNYSVTETSTEITCTYTFTPAEDDPFSSPTPRTFEEWFNGVTLQSDSGLVNLAPKIFFCDKILTLGNSEAGWITTCHEIIFGGSPRAPAYIRIEGGGIWIDGAHSGRTEHIDESDESGIFIMHIDNVPFLYTLCDTDDVFNRRRLTFNGTRFIFNVTQSTGSAVIFRIGNVEVNTQLRNMVVQTAGYPATGATFRCRFLPELIGTETSQLRNSVTLMGFIVLQNNASKDMQITTVDQGQYLMLVRGDGKHTFDYDKIGSGHTLFRLRAGTQFELEQPRIPIDGDHVRISTDDISDTDTLLRVRDQFGVKVIDRGTRAPIAGARFAAFHNTGQTVGVSTTSSGILITNVLGLATHDSIQFLVLNPVADYNTDFFDVRTDNAEITFAVRHYEYEWAVGSFNYNTNREHVFTIELEQDDSITSSDASTALALPFSYNSSFTPHRIQIDGNTTATLDDLYDYVKAAGSIRINHNNSLFKPTLRDRTLVLDGYNYIHRGSSVLSSVTLRDTFVITPDDIGSGAARISPFLISSNAVDADITEGTVRVWYGDVEDGEASFSAVNGTRVVFRGGMLPRIFEASNPDHKFANLEIDTREQTVIRAFRIGGNMEEFIIPAGVQTAEIRPNLTRDAFDLSYVDSNGNEIDVRTNNDISFLTIFFGRQYRQLDLTGFTTSNRFLVGGEVNTLLMAATYQRYIYDNIRTLPFITAGSYSDGVLQWNGVEFALAPDVNFNRAGDVLLLGEGSTDSPQLDHSHIPHIHLLSHDRFFNIIISGNVSDFTVRSFINNTISDPISTGDGYLLITQTQEVDVRYIVSSDGYYAGIIEGNTASLYRTVIDLEPLDLAFDQTARDTIQAEITAGNISWTLDTTAISLTIEFDYPADRTFTHIEMIALFTLILTAEEYLHLVLLGDNNNRLSLGLTSLHLFGDIFLTIADGNTNIVQFESTIDSAGAWNPVNDESNSVLSADTMSGAEPDERQILNAINSMRNAVLLQTQNSETAINNNTNAARDNINAHTTHQISNDTAAVTNTVVARIATAETNIIGGDSTDADTSNDPRTITGGVIELLEAISNAESNIRGGNSNIEALLNGQAGLAGLNTVSNALMLQYRNDLINSNAAVQRNILGGDGTNADTSDDPRTVTEVFTGIRDLLTTTESNIRGGNETLETLKTRQEAIQTAQGNSDNRVIIAITNSQTAIITRINTLQGGDATDGDDSTNPISLTDAYNALEEGRDEQSNAIVLAILGGDYDAEFADDRPKNLKLVQSELDEHITNVLSNILGTTATPTTHANLRRIMDLITANYAALTGEGEDFISLRALINSIKGGTDGDRPDLQILLDSLGTVSGTTTTINQSINSVNNTITNQTTTITGAISDMRGGTSTIQSVSDDVEENRTITNALFGSSP